MPPETILIDWQYGSGGNWPSLAALQRLEHPVWGASAIRSGFDAKYALAPLGMRVDNILAWERLRRAGSVEHLLHTFWARTNSLTPNYGPWEGWLPGFLAAADAAAWERHPLKPLCDEVDEAMTAPEWTDLDPLIGRLESFTHDDSLVRDCVAWWVLSLQQRQAVHHAVEVALRNPAYEAVAPYRGIDPDALAARRKTASQYRGQAEAWRQSALAWLKAHGYSDVPEYLASKMAGIERCLAMTPGV